jgi:hypothetical protein
MGKKQGECVVRFLSNLEDQGCNHGKRDDGLIAPILQTMLDR